jgi:hypothetical protein
MFGQANAREVFAQSRDPDPIRAEVVAPALTCLTATVCYILSSDGNLDRVTTFLAPNASSVPLYPKDVCPFTKSPAGKSCRKRLRQVFAQTVSEQVSNPDSVRGSGAELLERRVLVDASSDMVRPVAVYVSATYSGMQCQIPKAV